MPKQEDDIFKFDPKSFWKELAESEQREYISIVDEEIGKDILVPVSQLENKDEELLIANAKKFYRQYKFIEKNLESKKIEETILWLQKDSNLLNSIARQLAFRFIRSYENLIKIHLEQTPKKIDFKLPLFTSIFNDDENVAFVRLDLDDQKTEQIINHLKQYLALKFESAKIWEKIAKEVLVYLALPAIEK
ncbi:MAG: hypothetical protein HC939_23305 [Pleurocapsa sp. SU_5_0]|nr:hypothetical protein [Pleurocapsa sp. SU_5_0]